MTDLAVVDRLARLEDLVGRLEAVAGLVEVTPAAVNPDGTPGPVAAGELIQASWGNAVVDTLNRRVGVGLFLGTNLSVPVGSNPAIAYDGEAYDTDNFHAPSATDLIIPANRAGVYTITYTVVTTTATTGNCLVRIVVKGSAIKQNTIVTGQSIASVSYTGPFAVGDHVQTTFWNAGTGAIFIAPSVEMLRVAI